MPSCDDASVNAVLGRRCVYLLLCAAVSEWVTVLVARMIGG